MLKGFGKSIRAKGKGLKERAGTALKKHRIKKLDERRRKRASVPAGSVYKRRLVPPSQRPELLRYLRQNLFKPNFFENLPDLHAKRVKRLDFHFFVNRQEHVVPVAIKNTNPPGLLQPLNLDPKSQGKNFEEVRKSFLAHQMAVRKGKINPKTYILRSPKVYGRIGNFLVMEYVAKTPLPKELWKQIWPELEKNLSRSERKTPARKRLPSPQALHVMPVANTKPESLDGKWVVFLPYDYA